MTPVEQLLQERLRDEANRVPVASGDLQRVMRVGRRRLIASRAVSSVTLAALVTATVLGAMALTGGRSDVAGEGTIFESGYALNPMEQATKIVACMQGQGLAVTQNLDAVQWDDPALSQSEFERAYEVCKEQLRDSGFLLMEDNPDNLRVGYAQYLALAECYRSAGIEISPAPGLDEFIDDYRSDSPALWSPQAEAIARVGVDATGQAERGCDIPTPSEGRSDG